MAEDIDDLLDEVEKKFSGGRKLQNSTKCMKEMSRTKQDEDISDILSDPELKIESHEHHRVRRCRNKLVDANCDDCKELPTVEKRCWPVFIGGSNFLSGHSTSVIQRRTCDRLRCTSCDLPVSQFDGFKWAAGTDYLFLRNSVPDFTKLKARLLPSKG